MISFDDVTKQYPDGTVAVDDLTLEVPDGTLTVFVGPSGCGKTTSMRMINRMIDPTSGTLTVDGDDVTKVDPVKLRLGIGYVIQSAGLMPHQRVVDNVATVPVLNGESRRVGTQGRARRARARRAGPRAGQPLSGAAVGRSAAARRGGAGAGRRPADPVDGRAVQRRRPGGSRGAAGRDPAAAKRTAQDDRVRHPRHRRGRQARRQGRGVRRRRATAAVRRAARLLSNPANDFVSGFVGADRGYRGLQFRHATGLPLHEIRSVAESDIDALSLGPEDWVLVTKADGKPYAWINADGVKLHRKGNSLYDSTYRRRVAVPARRHAASGAGRGAVVAVRSGRGGRRRRATDRRCARRRRAGRPEFATARGPAGAGRRELSVRYLLTHLDDAWALTMIHLRLSLIPIVLGLLIAVPLGALVQRTTALRRLTTITASIIFTIPSLALFVALPLIIPTRILDEANVIVALTLYTDGAAGAGRTRGAGRGARAGARRGHRGRLPATDADAESRTAAVRFRCSSPACASSPSPTSRWWRSAR